MKENNSPLVSASKTQLINNQQITKNRKKEGLTKKAILDKSSNMAKKNFVPKLISYNYDLSRQWFILYKDKKGKSQQARGNINTYKTVEERTKAAVELMNEITILISEDLTEVEQKFKKAVALHTARLDYKTLRSYNTKTKWFLEFLRAKKVTHLAQVTEGVVVEFFKNYLTNIRKIKNGTYNGYLSHLGCIWDNISPQPKKNPFKVIKKLPDNSNSFPPFQKHQKTRILAYCQEHEPQLHLFIMFMRMELSRPHQETRLVKIGDIDFDRKLIYFESVRNKNKRQIWKLIPDEFYEKLMELKIYEHPDTYYLFGKFGQPGTMPHTKKYFSDIHQAVLKKLKIDTHKYKLRCWRPDATIEYLEAGFSTVEVKEHGGWQSVEMVERYAQRIGFKPNSRIRNVNLYKG